MSQSLSLSISIISSKSVSSNRATLPEILPNSFSINISNLASSISFYFLIRFAFLSLLFLLILIVIIDKKTKSKKMYEASSAIKNSHENSTE